MYTTIEVQKLNNPSVTSRYDNGASRNEIALFDEIARYRQSKPMQRM